MTNEQFNLLSPFIDELTMVSIKIEQAQKRSVSVGELQALHSLFRTHSDYLIKKIIIENTESVKQKLNIKINLWN